MVSQSLIHACEQVLHGDLLNEFLDVVVNFTPVETFTEEIDGETDEYISLPEVGVLISEHPSGIIDRIIYDVKFPGKINQVQIGMSGDEVEQLLGAPDRLWPMPHPNFILIYDAPTFFRVELNRDTEKVIVMIR